MKGGISHRSTETFTSVRGEETLNTPSCVFILPFKAVICSICAVSIFLSCARPEIATNSPIASNQIFDIFICMIRPFFMYNEIPITSLIFSFK